MKVLQTIQSYRLNRIKMILGFTLLREETSYKEDML
jgi:hypothetical protein